MSDEVPVPKSSRQTLTFFTRSRARMSSATAASFVDAASVSSIVTIDGSRLFSRTSVSKRSGKPRSPRNRADRLTPISMYRPFANQTRVCSIAARNTKSVSSMISPLSSAIPMKSRG